MTYTDLTTEPQRSPEAVTRWLRGAPKPDDRRCACCPEQPSHVYAYVLELADPEADTRWQIQDLSTRERTGVLDYVGFLNDAVARMPEGTRFRIVVEPIGQEAGR